MGGEWGRGAGTVSEELRRNAVGGLYLARKAIHKAYVKRKYSKVQSMKVVKYGVLQRFVEEKMALDWSPEMIAGRIKKIDRSYPRVSAKAIYKFVYSVYGRKIEKHLYRKRVKRKGGPKRGSAAVMDGRVSIEKCSDPHSSDTHWTIDLILAGACNFANSRGDILSAE